MKTKLSYEELEAQIIELKRENEQIRKFQRAEEISNSKYCRMICNIGDVIAIIDQEGRNRYKSENIEKYFGWKPEEVLGKSTFDNVHSDDKERALGFFSNLLSKPGLEGTIELRYKCKDGSYRWIEFTGSNLIHDPDINGILGNYHDITERRIVDEKIRKLSRAVEQSPASIVITNLEGEIEYTNPKFTELTGYSRDEALGENPRILKTDKTSGSDYEELWKTITSGSVWKGSFQNKKKNGDLYWEMASISPIKNADGEITHFVAVKEDITEKRRAEQALMESERKFRILFETLPTGVTLADQEGQILESNPAAERILGLSMEEQERRSIDGVEWKIIKLDGSVMSPDEYASVRAIRENKAIRGVEMGVIKGIDDIAWISVNASPIDNFGIVISYEDITDRRLAENEHMISKEKAEQSRANLKAIIENSIESIWSIDTNYNIQYINDVFAKAFEASFGVLLSKGDNILAALPDPIRPIWKERYDRAFNSEHFLFIDEVDVGDTTIFIEVAMNPISIEGKVVGASFYGKDISERKIYEKELLAAKSKAEESDRLKSAFLANMSHEIRTPMNGILGFAELLREPGLSGEEQQDYVDIIQKSGRRMLNIINDIVSISKIESGHMDVDMEEFNINRQMEEILALFKLEVEGKGMQLSLQPSLANDNAFIKSDREKVYAILTNLVKNAIKYSKEGSIQFGYLDKGGLLQFFVKDSGVGIPKERQQAIFDRFVQADIANKRARQGAGLGLSISKAYVEMLGGEIWVESNLGKGSTFYFTLRKMNEGTQGDPDQSAVSNGEQIPKGKKLKILIAEDDELSERLISITVREFAKEVIRVSTGKEAVEVCRNNGDINLVLMDIQMPEMDGYEATRQIRTFNKDLIIIAQTAYALEGDREKAIGAGCNDYISKPVKVQDLKQLINKYLS